MAKKGISEEERKQAMLQLQLMQQEAQKIEEQILELERRKLELDIVLMSLEEISKHKTGHALIPVGSGVFIEGKITNNEHALVNVGSNIIIKKSMVQAKKSIKAQISEVDSIREKLQEELQEFVAALGAMRPQM